jgi:A/G-specific adenine glycosylase
MDGQRSRLEAVGIALCDWFDAQHRELPWRHTRDPYAIWVSEVMLQQTRVETVIAYYQRFMARYPTMEALAAAQRDELYKLWEGLGYYRRADNLHKGARYVAETLRGCFPSDPRELLKIPGIGEYTAGAIASMAFGERAAAVDGNVLRVIARIEGIEASVDRPATRRQVGELSLAMMPSGRAWSHTQALMELGALICLPKNPRCQRCPAAELCRAKAWGAAERLPVKAEKKKPVVMERTILLITDGERVLLHRRPKGGLLAGLWEFPGREEGLLEELESVDSRPGPKARHVFTHRVWLMESLWIRVKKAPAPAQCRWADRTELEALALPMAMAAFRKYAMEQL